MTLYLHIFHVKKHVHQILFKQYLHTSTENSKHSLLFRDFFAPEAETKLHGNQKPEFGGRDSLDAGLLQLPLQHPQLGLGLLQLGPQ